MSENNTINTENNTINTDSNSDTELNISIDENNTINTDSSNEEVTAQTINPSELTRGMIQEIGEVSDKMQREVMFSDLDVPKVGYPEVNLVNNMQGTLGLSEELSEEETAKMKQLAHEILISNDAFNEDKNLDTDNTRSNYNYVAVAFIGPGLSAKSEIYGFNVLGAFETIDLAQDYIEDLDISDRIYDICIIEMYKFIPSYPVKKRETQEEVDKFLNDIIVEHKTKLEENKQIYNYRKDRLKNQKGRIIEIEEVKEEEVKEEVKLPEEITHEINKESEKLKENEKEIRDETHKRLVEKLEKRREKNMSVPSNTSETKKMQLRKINSKIHNQNFAAICFVGHSGNNSRVAMKIKGIFESEQECKDFCKECMDVCDTYDITCAELYNWLPSDPSIEKIAQVHRDELLNEMFDAEKKEQAKTNKIHDEKKNTTLYTESEVGKLVGASVTGNSSSVLASKVLEDML